MHRTKFQNFRPCTVCGGKDVILSCPSLQIISTQSFIPYEPFTTSLAKAILESLFANTGHFLILSIVNIQIKAPSEIFISVSCLTLFHLFLFILDSPEGLGNKQPHCQKWCPSHPHQSLNAPYNTFTITNITILWPSVLLFFFLTLPTLSGFIQISFKLTLFL